MAKIIKNNLGNFLVFWLIFLITFTFILFLTNGQVAIGSPGTQTLNPNATGTYQQWPTLGGTTPTHWEATKDDDDSTYIETQTQGHIDTQNLDNPTFADSDIVNSVTIYCRAYAIGSKGPEKISFFDRLDTTDRDQRNNIGVTRDLWDQYNSATLTTAPDGGGWTKQKVTDLQVGITASTLDTETLRVSKIWIVVDYSPAAVSISLVSPTTPGQVNFGTLILGNATDTTPLGIDDVETVQVDSGPADLDIKTTFFATSSYEWTLSSDLDSGPNEVVWQFATSTDSTWNLFSASSTLYTLANNVAQGNTQDIYFKITIPTETASYNKYYCTVTIVASSP